MSVNDADASLFPTYTIEVATFMEALSFSGSSYLSTQAMVVTLGSDLFSPFSFEVVVDNPSADPEQNYWRLMVLDAEGKTLQTNERSWTGFPLSGTFSRQGELIGLDGGAVLGLRFSWRNEHRQSGLEEPPRSRQPARL